MPPLSAPQPCGSLNHPVLIPTVLDQLSADAVDRFIVQIEEERVLWPTLKIAGVVGTMCSTTLWLTHEKDAIRLIIERLENRVGHPQLFPAGAFIAENPLLSQAAGIRIAYAERYKGFTHRAFRENIKSLASSIEEGLRGKQTYADWKSWLQGGSLIPSLKLLGATEAGSEPNTASISIS